ncbi:MAG: hypothetical protein BGO98_37905 [Myxococcales bacterium 68-20]|nr:MAG: hypothetical protein BGO98_37905 [Myxococcales bacterium 68-20]
MALRGIFPGAPLPYVPLERFIDTSALDAIHEEVCLALTQVAIDYTGGSHRSMGIMPPSRTAEAYVDYGEAIRSLSPDAFETFRSLADDPSAIDRQHSNELRFGEETELPLSRRQMLWLKFRQKVYFPWKAYVELIPNRYWDEKSSAEGKDFTRLAKTFFPKTIAFAKSLPFLHIGRCNVMGLEANDHGTVHRDGDPDEQEAPDHFITVCPAGDKRLFLWDEEKQRKTPVEGRAYWFNDHDFHGVDADPFFRYSIRVDGVFRPDFLETLRRESRIES